jgi:hypothetical protein
MRKFLFALAATAAALAGSRVFAEFSRFPHELGPGFTEAWGHGKITSPLPCSTPGKCEVIATGTGHAITFDAGGDIGNYDFTADLRFDRSHPAPNGFGGQCLPGGGTLTIVSRDGNSTLLFDIQGQECAVGAGTMLSTITAAYVTDTPRSTGKFNT